MLVGSFSSNAWGRPRSTKDVDFVVHLSETSLPTIAADVGADCVLDQQASFETITGATCHRLRLKGSAFYAELFLLRDDEYSQTRFRRRVTATVYGKTVSLAAPEDVVIVKLRWSRHGNRPQDIEDVRDVLSVQAGKLDLAYIRNWCDQHGTRELFERVLKESEL
jgi:hypothetical protein